MTESSQNVNSIAKLENVMIFNELMDRLVNAPFHLPNMGVFYGRSGDGKTYSATYAAHVYGALYLEISTSWTKTKFYQNLLKELGEGDERTNADRAEKCIAALQMQTRPIIIDEFDFFAEGTAVEVIREFCKPGFPPIILIGEELLPDKLSKNERFHNRILSWTPAVAASRRDVDQLAELYHPKLNIDKDLKDKIYKVSDSRIRRICVNLAMIQDAADSKGIEEISLSEFNGNDFYVAHAPTRKRGR